MNLRKLISRLAFLSQFIDLGSARIRKIQYSSNLVIGFAYGIILRGSQHFKVIVFLHQNQFRMTAGYYQSQ